MTQFSVHSVRHAPASFRDNVLALVEFSFAPNAFDTPLVLTRWVKGKDGADGKSYKAITIQNARMVTVHDAQLVAHRPPAQPVRHFISVPNMEIPREVSDAVAAEALRKLNAPKVPAPAGIAAANAPMSAEDVETSYGVESPQFQHQEPRH